MINHNEAIISLAKDIIKIKFKKFGDETSLSNLIFDLRFDEINPDKKLEIYFLNILKPFLLVIQENSCVGKIWISQLAKEKHLQRISNAFDE